jgi:hypothetical protein
MGSGRSIGEGIADMETDAVFDPPLRRPGGGSSHAALHRDGAADRIDGARELDQQAVSRDMADSHLLSSYYPHPGAAPCVVVW